MELDADFGHQLLTLRKDAVVEDDECVFDDRAGLAQRYPTASSLLAAALISPNKLHGWLCLTEKLGGGEFSEDDERLAVILAGMAGRIYENGRLYADVRQYSQRLEGEIAERERAAEQLRASSKR